MPHPAIHASLTFELTCSQIVKKQKTSVKFREDLKKKQKTSKGNNKAFIKEKIKMTLTPKDIYFKNISKVFKSTKRKQHVSLNHFKLPLSERKKQ